MIAPLLAEEAGTSGPPKKLSLEATFTTPAWHHVERYASNPIEADHGRLKCRRRAMRGLQSDQTRRLSSLARLAAIDRG